jgi:hypothetical protein
MSLDTYSSAIWLCAAEVEEMPGCNDTQEVGHHYS